ncbi:hypothetical protein [Mucilaginibacter jinjuensis]|uniref:Subunit length determinant protein n=1 Tax=Mucilaginibacter jinjuensis TaxID=1176721 RepID=A0ABY7T5X5_9SPHI|nr:hypothetical protein [Mucilaginibacter jinjuensis]WCT11880.1 hypothetical protein PQO05_24410 [Mucilaginibacter jinjuensis]
MPGDKDQNAIKDWRAIAVNTLKYLLKYWYLIILGAVLGGAIGFIKVYKKKPVYISTFNFVLSTDQKDRNAFAGLASQLGFDGITSSPDNIFSGDNIIELFKSRKLIGSALQSVVDSASHQTLLNYIVQNEYPRIYKNLGPFSQNPATYSPIKTKLYRRIITEVGLSFTVFKKDKKLIFYLISASSTNPNIAYYVSKYMLGETSDYFIDTKTKVAATTVKLLQHEADSLAGVLSGTAINTAATIDRTYNLNPSLSIQRSGLMFSQAKVTAFSGAYAEVMRNLEVAKINLQKETPLYRIIDEPELPLIAEPTGKTKHVLITTIIGFILITLLLGGDYLYKNLNAHN